MVSVEEFEHLARYLARDLSPLEATELELRLAGSDELRAAVAQLQQLDATTKALPLATLDAAQVEEAVTRAMRHRLRSRRARLVALAAVLALVVAGGAVLDAQRRPRLATIGSLTGPVLVDGRPAVAGEVINNGAHLSTGALGLVSLQWGNQDHLVLAAESEARVLAGPSMQLLRGALAAQGHQVRVWVGDRAFIISGQAVLSREPLAQELRDTGHSTLEQLVNVKRMTMGAAMLSGAIALYVLQGSVEVESAGEASVIHAPQRWFSAARASPAGVTEIADAGALTTAEPVDGLLELHVAALGRAVSGAQVKLYELGPIDRANNRRTWRSHLGSSQTDDAGVVLLAANAGTYVAAVRAQGWPVTLREMVRPGGASRTQVEIAIEPGVPLTGRTEDARAHQPVAPATVTLTKRHTPDDEAIAIDVDGRGHFAFASLAPGPYEVVGLAPGVGRVRTQVHLPATEPLTLVFRPSGFVEGFVQFVDGGVAAGAKVLLVGNETVVSETSASGSFSIEAAPGAWRAQASAGTLVGAAAGELWVRSGQTTSAGVMTLQAASRVFGRVLSGDAGVPQANVVVSPHHGDGEIGRAQTDASGQYSISLVAGLYDVTAKAAGAAETSVRGLQVTRETRFDLHLPLLGSIRGEVVDVGGAPLDNVAVSLSPQFERGSRTTLSKHGQFEFLNVTPGMVVLSAKPNGVFVGASKLVRVDPGQVTEPTLSVPATGELEVIVNWQCPGQSREVSVFALKTDGAFTPGSATGRQLMPSGQRRAKLRMAVGTYVIVANSGGDDCTGQANVTVDPARSESVAITLVNKKHAIEVHVVGPDGLPSPAELLVTTTEGGHGASLSASTDEQGLWRSREPLLKVVATSGGRSGSVGPIDEGVRSVVVTLSEGQPLELLLDGAVAGTQSRVELVAPPDFSYQDVIVTTQTRLSLESVPRGRLHVTVHNESRSGDAEVMVKPGETAKLTVHLEEGGAVQGRLVDESGRPTAGWVGLQSTAVETEEPVSVDDTGVFKLWPVAPGAYHLSLGTDLTSTPVIVKSGEVTDVGDVTDVGSSKGVFKAFEGP